MDVLVAAVARSRRFRRDPPDPDALTAALTALRLANSDPDGALRATAAVRAPARYRAIAGAAAGRDLTRQDMIGILTRAGYSAASAGGRMSSSHPLFTRTGPDRAGTLARLDRAGPFDRPGPLTRRAETGSARSPAPGS